jgi:nucleoside-diphosphate-sugar epimerase
MRALVTGGNRYIGVHLLFELARRGHEVTVVNSHVGDMPEGCRRIHADRTVPGALAEALGPHRDEFDIVFDNTAYRVADLEPMIELFEGRVAQFVFTSSVAVYRRSFVQPVREGSRRHDPADTDPRKAYGVGKVTCEDHLRARFEATGFPATSLRVTHTLGPRTPLVTREPVIFKRLEEGRPIFVPGDGFPFVHLVHVQDVASLMASLCGWAPAIGQAYNVAGAELTSVEGCIRLMARAVGVEPRIVHVPLPLARRARPPLLHWGEALTGGAVFSIDKALAELDWRPAFGLEDGYASSYRWFDEVGRDLFTYDFGGDDELLAQVGEGGRP